MHPPALVSRIPGTVVSRPAPSPFSEAYARLSELCSGLRIEELGPGERTPSDDGWVTTEQLLAGGAELDTFLAWDDAQVIRDFGQRARPDVIASFALHRYAWPVCLLITVPWFLHRRVPRLRTADVAIQRTLGRTAVRTDTFACLPGDPAAALPGARVVPDEEALRTEVRAAVAEHLEPVLAVLGPRMRRRGRALWGMATDEVVEGLWYIGHLLGEEQRATAELARLLPGSTTPFAGGASFRELTAPDGGRLPTRDRASCCLFYTLRPQDTCTTCPRTCDEVRVEKLTAERG